MARSFRGRLIGASVTPAVNAAPGIWSLDDVSAGCRANIWPTPADANYSSVSLLLHMTGPNGGTTFLDTSPSPQTVTRVGAVTSATPSRFATGSGRFQSGAGYLQVPASVFNFGSSDFVVEWWQFIPGHNISGGGNQPGIWSNGRRSGVTEGIACYMQTNGAATGRLHFDCNIGGAWNTYLFSDTGYTPAVWQHFAISRSGTTYRMYQSGVRVSQVTDAGSLDWPNTAAGSIGAASGAGEFGASTHALFLSDFRVTIGTARGYTGSTITVPVPEFPNY